jgi:hypothetical protein
VNSGKNKKMYLENSKSCQNIANLHSLFKIDLIDFDLFVFNATFSNISAIPWQPVIVVEEAGVPGENHRPWASN